jgi:LysR family transcriptional regulator of abg operon
MKLNQLRDVMAVAERGSLRAAARHLGVAQPALTRSIQELERELGVPLFEREAKGVVPTRMGELFIRRANAVRSELRRAREEIDQLKGEMHGHVGVCLSTVPHIALMPYVLPAFRARYPDVHLDIAEGLYPTVEGPLRMGLVDCYVGPPPRDSPGSELVVEKLFDNTRVIMSRRGHPLARARSLADLIDAEWLTTSITHKADEELDPLFAQHGLPAPRIVMQAHSSLTYIVAVAYSDLLIMVPRQWLDFPFTRDLLQRIDVEEPLPAPPICLVRRAGLPLTPAAEYFCDMIRRASGHLTAPAKTAAGVFPGTFEGTKTKDARHAAPAGAARKSSKRTAA